MKVDWGEAKEAAVGILWMFLCVTGATALIGAALGVLLGAMGLVLRIFGV